MKCFECGKGKLINKVAEVEGEVRGEKYTVRTEATICDRCGSQVLSHSQSTAYGIAIADAYRKKHGLLTSKELKDIRRKLHMNQQQFAHFVGVSSASVKRWEIGLIQDEANDHLVRLKTDLDAARRNVHELEMRLHGTALRQTTTVLVGRSRSASEWDLATFDIAQDALDYTPTYCPVA